MSSHEFYVTALSAVYATARAIKIALHSTRSVQPVLKKNPSQPVQLKHHTQSSYSITELRKINFKLWSGSGSKCYLGKNSEQKSITAVMLGALQTQPLISALVQREIHRNEVEQQNRGYLKVLFLFTDQYASLQIKQKTPKVMKYSLYNGKQAKTETWHFKMYIDYI